MERITFYGGDWEMSVKNVSPDLDIWALIDGDADIHQEISEIVAKIKNPTPSPTMTPSTKYTQEDLYAAILALDEDQGSFSALEVKNVLRDMGRYAVQRDVSQDLNDLYDENAPAIRRESIRNEDGDTHFRYTINFKRMHDVYRGSVSDFADYVRNQSRTTEGTQSSLDNLKVRTRKLAEESAQDYNETLDLLDEEVNDFIDERERSVGRAKNAFKEKVRSAAHKTANWIDEALSL